MNPKTNLMIAAAILLIVYNLMNKEGSVSQIAEMDESQLIDRAASASDMSGFSKDAELAIDVEDADIQEPEQRARVEQAMPGPAIGDYSAAPAAPSSSPATLARMERPSHHNLKPGEKTTGFNPTIR